MNKIARPIVWVLGFAIALVAIYTAAFGIIDEIYQRSITVAVSVILSIFATPLAGLYQSDKKHIKAGQWAVDFILIFLMALSILWFSSVYDELESGLYSFLPIDIAVGCGGLIVVIEMTRRCFGTPLAFFAVLTIVYALFGADLPWIFAHGGYDLESVMRTVWYSFDGVFGFIVIIVISLIFIFIIFGTVLEATGAGATLLKISVSLTGAMRGGPAHAAIAASGFFGTISGAVTANVVGTGVFTIPMIKARGFKSSFAGGVEAAASSGGQFMPPVMGAVAFVMADFTGIPYLIIITAALMPALFYYGSLFIAVWVEAGRLGITAIPKEEREVLTRDDWIKSLMFIVPVLVIIGVLATGRSPAAAGLWAAIAGMVMGFINPVVRKRPQIFIDAIAKGGQQCAQIMVAVAAIGIIVGIMNLTGLGIRFSNMVLAFAGTNLFFALVLMAMASLVLGMGLPTIPAYVIIIIIMGGAIEKLGVPKMLVHLFVVYFGVLSAITPPVAIAAYAAAPIAQSNPLHTAFQALRLSFVGFIIPFVLIYNPSLSLVYEFEVVAFISVVFRLSLAIWLMTTALGGVDRDKLSIYSRVLRMVLGITVLLSFVAVQIIGVLASLALLFIEARIAKKKITSDTVVSA
ncbi:MAG: TRAP transporter fused permease subunit [Rhodospirillaceae bacterium]|nr:TRAP transporter fused permease subunit [Rhodospirillaceae bacterium]MBT4588652.1 TRAP transporter fused permease subunit [Rhodospirillaceae bacterium]MBT5939901.1 TRAP transporter fused permease subunit [Rhodospirillaceae bacterium]MBT7266106.1 TRAP transporter fused permease subunit [Rhodospirillaceae bacterium]